MTTKPTRVYVSRITSTPLRRLAIVAAYLPMAAFNLLMAVLAAIKWCCQLLAEQHATAKEQWRSK